MIMNFNYLGCPHNKLFLRNPYVYKFFKSDKKYNNEKYFYLNYKIDYIPKLCCFSDKRRLLVLSFVGHRIKKKQIDIEALKYINNYFIKKNIFHNDYRVKNILYNEKENKYYFIDWEHFDTCFNDNRKSRKSDDLRDILF